MLLAQNSYLPLWGVYAILISAILFSFRFFLVRGCLLNDMNFNVAHLMVNKLTHRIQGCVSLDCSMVELISGLPIEL